MGNALAHFVPNQCDSRLLVHHVIMTLCERRSCALSSRRNPLIYPGETIDETRRCISNCVAQHPSSCRPLFHVDDCSLTSLYRTRDHDNVNDVLRLLNPFAITYVSGHIFSPSLTITLFNRINNFRGIQNTSAITPLIIVRTDLLSQKSQWDIGVPALSL